MTDISAAIRTMSRSYTEMSISIRNTICGLQQHDLFNAIE